MEKIHGLIDAPFTPFYENGEVNYEPIEAYCQLLVRNGLQGVFINGSSGEGYMLTEDERMKLAERWMEVAPEGFKVIVHVGSTCVKSSKRLAEHAQKIGAWGIGAMAPPFPKVGRIEELVKYCEEIACGAPALPFYFYHIPAFNGAFLSMVAFLEAVDGRIPNFAGIKYTFESLYEYNQCRLYKNGKFVHCPWITLFFEEIDAGLLVKDRKELNTLKVEHQLYKNCSKYGFIYKNNMDKFLMNFTGEVYIAKTVYLNFEEEMKKLFGSKVIYIIPDTGGEN